MNISRCALYTNEFTVIDNALKNNRSLESLSINDFAFSVESLETFSMMLTDHPEITTVELSRCSSAEMVGLLSKINQTNTKKLVFHRSDLAIHATDRLAEIIPTLEKVQVLDLQNNRLSNEEIDILQRAVKQNSLPMELKLPEKKMDFSQFRLLRF